MSAYLFLLALGATVIGIVPTLVGGALAMTTLLFVIGFPVSLAAAWLTAPQTVTPFFGTFGFLAFLGALIGTAVCYGDEDRAAGARLGTVALVLWVVAFAAVHVWGSPILRADDYAGMTGEVAKRDWTSDIQPKDPAHMRLVPIETARYEARKVMAQYGAIGSQFSLTEDNVMPQKVGDRLVYVMPLEFVGFGAWQSTGGIPGWVAVDAEDPHARPRLVETGRPMPFTPGAFFGHDLMRVLRGAGITEGVEQVRFRLDAEGRPHWVASLTRPVHASFGNVMVGVAIVDPYTGTVERHGMGDAPDYVDVLYPPGVVNGYLADRGELSDGWWNSVFAHAGLTKPEPTRLVEGNGGRLVYVTGMTSSSEHDDSLVSLVYTDPMTGRSVDYGMAGGGTEMAAVRAADGNPTILLNHLKAELPQVYNVDGNATTVMPLMGQTGGYQGVAMSEVSDVNAVAWGPDAATAVQRYRAMLAERSRGPDLGKGAGTVEVSGRIDRIAWVPGGQDYQFDVVGDGRMFVASMVGFPSLVLTRPGDAVTFRTTTAPAAVLPALDFANHMASFGANAAAAATGAPVDQGRATDAPSH